MTKWPKNVGVASAVLRPFPRGQACVVHLAEIEDPDATESESVTVGHAEVDGRAVTVLAEAFQGSSIGMVEEALAGLSAAPQACPQASPR